MSDQEEDFEQEEYQDDDDEYQYDDDGEGDYEMEVEKPSGNCFTPSKTGLKYDGKLLDQIAIPSKNACYSVYRQLSEVCLVDVNEIFYSAMLTVKVRDQFIIATIQFPMKEPFFPYAPPVFSLQSHFKSPSDHYNIIFNCHPSLLKSRWNICTSIDEIIRDMIEIAKQSVVDMVDDDPHSTTAQLIELIRTNEIDISGLFPNNKLHNLPSFGVIRESAATVTKGKTSKGTGYSDSHGTSTWNFANHNLTRLDNLRGLLKVFESLVMDTWVIDTIYYIMNDLISPIITLDEYFRNFEYYSIVISSIAALADPSPHIVPSPGLMKLYENLNDPKIKSTLEKNELALLTKLGVIYRRFSQPAVEEGPEVIDLTGDEEYSPNKKRTRGTVDSGNVSSSSSSSSSSSVAVVSAASGSGSGCDSSNGANSSSEKAPDPSPSPLSAKLVQYGSTVRSRVVEVEEPFNQHLFLSEMNKTVHLPAKWYRKLRIELSTMPESLPNNVIVFTGIDVSQPCLMKVLMFPECEDTPYCGGCFEFDIFIPPEYPLVSPKVLLVTTGYGTVRFNPNLYNCGKVCLSLLGTWSGEPWNPEVSNLTQVFNSILFLIFIERPYFNEPGYQGSEGSTRGTLESDKYNEVIRIGTLEFGYLDHLKPDNKKRQMARWAVPGVIETWLTKGRKAALKWATEGQEKKIKGLIDSIDSAVAKNNV